MSLTTSVVFILPIFLEPALIRAISASGESPAATRRHRGCCSRAR